MRFISASPRIQQPLFIGNKPFVTSRPPLVTTVGAVGVKSSGLSNARAQTLFLQVFVCSSCCNVPRYQSKGITISPSSTNFFDDKGVNVQNFQGTGINAHQARALASALWDQLLFACLASERCCCAFKWNLCRSESLWRVASSSGFLFWHRLFISSLHAEMLKGVLRIPRLVLPKWGHWLLWCPGQ